MPDMVYTAEEIQRLLEQGAQLVDVLAAAEYELDHTPGAVNIPLKLLDAKTTAGLDRNRPVIVYCNDFSSDMSPRAAWRLETLGFTRVIDYAPGKQAWFGQNLPREGKAKSDLWIGDLADAKVPTCSLTERIGSIRERVRASGWETCVVVNDQRIVLGLLRGRALDSSPDLTAEAVMAPGPKTFRPNVTLTELVESMRQHDIKTNSLVTTNEGELIGVISRDDAEATLAHEAEHAEHADHGD